MSGTVDIAELEADAIPQDLVTVEVACKRADMSRRALERAAADGLITRYQVGNRKYRFSLGEVQGLVNEQRASEDPIEARAASLLAQAYSHNEILMRQVESYSDKLADRTGQLVSILIDRCKALEESHSELIKAREEALNESAARDIEAHMLMAEQSRKDQMTKVFFENVLPKALSHIGGKNPYQRFLESIPPTKLTELALLAETQLEALNKGECEPDDVLLTAEQLEMLKQFIKDK